MPSHQERRDPLPKEYRFGDASVAARFSVALDANIASHRFPFTPQGIADCVDDAELRAVFPSDADRAPVIAGA